MSASAQSLAYAQVTQPDLGAFPIITTYLDAFDADGIFMDGLRTDEITILENGQAKKPTKLAALHTPLNFILAINASPSLAIRDANCASRYAKVVQHLSTWAASLPTDGRDAMSLVWNGGVVASELGATDWADHLAQFDPRLNNSNASLAALSFALDVAQSSPTTVGGKKAILLVSGHLNNADAAGIKDLLARAKDASVRIFVLAVDGPEYFPTAGIQELFKMAANSGGQYQTFSGSEEIVSPETWFAPLRSVYELSYQTELRQVKDVSFSVQVDHAGLSLTSQLMHFDLNVQPPQVSLLSPPVEITRDNPSNRFDLAGFYPKDTRISILIEYPDGKFRTIRRTTLYVDGIKAAENLSEPFNAFQWNIDQIQVTDYHSLQVEVEDVYGMLNKSSVVPVKVIVVEPAGGMLGRLLGNNWFKVVLLLVAGSGLLLYRVWQHRKASEPADHVAGKSKKPVAPALSQTKHEPIATVQRDDAQKVLPWIARRSSATSAHLLPIKEDGTPTGGSVIMLGEEMVKIGSDPKMANYVIDERSVAKLHARIIRNDAGEFVIYDERSLTGTWVNYSMVYEEGKALAADDIINFGNACFRFVQDPQTPVKPKEPLQIP